MNELEKNRQEFLNALRSGNYKKGTTKSDERGKPIVESDADEGWCACALMHDLFFEYKGKQYGRNYLIALGLTPKDCRYIQQVLNDSDLTFPEIADRIEKEIFTR